LRVFSLFPDSHSFPQFVLLGMPAFFSVFGIRKMRSIKTYGLTSLLAYWLSVALLFLIIILSGTRGIWAASVGVVLLASGIILYTNKIKKTQTALKLAIANFRAVESVKVVKGITEYLILFFVMFAVAFPIFSSPQFLIGKSDDILKQRIKSILDFEETSNAQRIEIWKKTLSSIKERPLLGVGIGNYPVVLGQDIRLAKAGSSAHNLYLHIAAEMGILAGIIFIWFLWLLFKRNYEIFIREDDKQLKTYLAATLLFVPWVLIYSLTDIAIFDERALLFALIPIAIIFGIKNSPRLF